MGTFLISNAYKEPGTAKIGSRIVAARIIDELLAKFRFVADWRIWGGVINSRIYSCLSLEQLYTHYIDISGSPSFPGIFLANLSRFFN